MIYVVVAGLIVLGVFLIFRQRAVTRAAPEIILSVKSGRVTSFISLHGRIIDPQTNRPFSPGIINRAVDWLQRYQYLEPFSQGDRTLRLTPKGRANVHRSVLPRVAA